MAGSSPDRAAFLAARDFLLAHRADYERAVELVAAGVVPADALISAVVPLSEAADAFVQLERGGGVMKVLIDCRASADA